MVGLQNEGYRYVTTLDLYAWSFYNLMRNMRPRKRKRDPQPGATPKVREVERSATWSGSIMVECRKRAIRNLERLQNRRRWTKSATWSGSKMGTGGGPRSVYEREFADPQPGAAPKVRGGVPQPGAFEVTGFQVQNV